MQHNQPKAITTIFNTDKYSVNLGVVQSFSVSGDIMVDHDIFWQGGSSLLSNEVYNIMSSTSADWNTTTDSVNLSSVGWNEAYETIITQSDSWNDSVLAVSTSASLWNDAYDVLYSSINTWDSTEKLTLSAQDWNAMLDKTTTWDTITTIVQNNSADWSDNSNASNVQEWNDAAYAIATSADEWNNYPTWNDTTVTVQDTSASWSGGNDAYETLQQKESNWDDTHTRVSTLSSDWNETYSYINELSGNGFAALDSQGKLLSSQVPDLSITETYVVATPGEISGLIQSNNLQRGDVVIASQTSTPYIVIDERITNFGSYDSNTEEIIGFSKLVLDNVIRSVNDKVGPSIELYPADIDDSISPARRWVSQDQIDQYEQTTNTLELSTRWESAYNWMLEDSPTNNTGYNQTHFVNASGDSITGDLDVTGTLTTTDLIADNLTLTNDTTVSGLTATSILITDTSILSGHDVTITSPSIIGDASVTGNVHIMGDLRVDGNAYLSAGSGGVINVGDGDADQVKFHADVSSDIIPSATETYNLGSNEFKWNRVVARDGKFDNLVFEDLGVEGVATLAGKTLEYEYEEVTEPDPETGFRMEYNEETNEFERVVDPDGGTITTVLTSVTATPPGTLIMGEPIGFDNKEGALYPDVMLDGDMLVTGAISGRQASFAALTARNFVTEYESLTIRESDMTIINGNIIQTGGNIRLESDIAHIDDENTYIRFQEDQMTFRCHDVNFIRLSEYPTLDDIVIIGDENNPVDLQVMSPNDSAALYVDSATGFVGVGTPSPSYKLEVVTGEVKMPDDGALLIPAGRTSDRVNKPGSIRWNTELSMYEGYNSEQQAWAPLGTGVNRFTDADKDTYLSVDAVDYDDSDTIAIYTAGCSGLAVTPNQTVTFAGDIKFDRVSVFDTSVGQTHPNLAMIETDEYIFLMVNGKRRAIRLYDIPTAATFKERYETFSAEDIVEIGEYACSSGEYGRPPIGTIDNTLELVDAPGYVFPSIANSGPLYVFDVEDRPIVRILKKFTISSTSTEVQVGETYIIYQINLNTNQVLFYTEDGTQVGNTRLTAQGSQGQNNGWIVCVHTTDLQYTLVPHADDSDGDGLLDIIDPDDDNDGIPDYGDPDHPSNIGAVNTDGDAYMDPYDTDDDNDGILDEQDVDPLLRPDQTSNPLPGDYDGDHLKDEFDPDHGLSHGLWDQFNSPPWEEIEILWEVLDGQP